MYMLYIRCNTLLQTRLMRNDIKFYLILINEYRRIY